MTDPAVDMTRPAPDWLICCEIDAEQPVIAELFARKFPGEPQPPSPHNLFALVREGEALRVLTFVHVHPFGDVCLVGGALTDGEVYRSLPPDKAAELHASGGGLVHLLRYALRHLEARYDAVFASTSNPKAEAADLAVGFVHTGVPNLLVRWNKDLHPVVQRALIAKVGALDGF